MCEAVSRVGAGDSAVQAAAEELGCRDGRFAEGSKVDDVLGRLASLVGGSLGVADAGDGDAGDARTLAIERDPDGRRRRTFRDATAVLQESPWLDWPIEGARTAISVVRFVAQHYESPVARHSRWISDGKPVYSDVGCTQHQVGCQMLHEAVTYDQPEVGQFAAFELLARSL